MGICSYSRLPRDAMSQHFQLQRAPRMIPSSTGAVVEEHPTNPSAVRAFLRIVADDVRRL
jgi:hypothetical protein